MRLAITHEIHACMWNGCVAPLVRSGRAPQPALIIGPMKIKGEKKYRPLAPRPAGKTDF